jgi:hypothetical protein
MLDVLNAADIPFSPYHQPRQYDTNKAHGDNQYQHNGNSACHSGDTPVAKHLTPIQLGQMQLDAVPVPGSSLAPNALTASAAAS